MNFAQKITKKHFCTGRDPTEPTVRSLAELVSHKDGYTYGTLADSNTLRYLMDVAPGKLLLVLSCRSITQVIKPALEMCFIPAQEVFAKPFIHVSKLLILQLHFQVRNSRLSANISMTQTTKTNWLLVSQRV